MQTTLNALKAAALVALITVAAGVFLVLLQVSTAVKHADAAVKRADLALSGKDGVLDTMSATTAKAGATLDSINRLCPGPTDPARACGVLADLNRTMATIRGVAGQVEVAAIHENKQLTTIDGQEAKLVDDLHEVLTSSAGTAKAATLAIQQGTTTMAAEQPQVDALIKAATATVANPDVPILIHHAAGITASGDQITKDAADKIHQYVHPNKKKVTFWGSVDGFMMYLHSRVIPPLF